MKTTTLSELLTPDQLAEVEKILLNSTPEDITENLKAYFRTFGAELEKKGVVADYLGYRIAYEYMETMRHNSALN